MRSSSFNCCTHHLLLITLISVNLNALLLSAVPERCLLLEESGKGGSICSSKLEGPSKTLILKNCVAKPANGANYSGCLDIARSNRRSICLVDIELSNLINHQEFAIDADADAQCDNSALAGPTIDLRITLKSIKQQPKDVTLFTRINNASVASFNIIDWQLSSKNLFDLIQANCRSTRAISISNVKSKEAIIERLFNSAFMAKLGSISIRDSSFKGIDREAFKLGTSVKRLELINVDLKGGRIESEAMKITRGCGEVSKLELSMENCRLSRSQLQPNFVTIEQSCIKPFNISLTGNLFERVLSEQTFGRLLNDIFKSDKVEVNLKSDEIDCCLPDNRWIFKLITKYNESRSRFTINCWDLGTDVHRLRNDTSISELCDKRNVYPVLTIAIVLTLLLAILMAIFSCICIFYVLPKRGDIIMINRDHNSAQQQQQQQQQQPHKHHLELLKSKSKKSTLEAVSTKTDVPHARSPLLSMSRKKAGPKGEVSDELDESDSATPTAKRPPEEPAEKAVAEKGAEKEKEKEKTPERKEPARIKVSAEGKDRPTEKEADETKGAEISPQPGKQSKSPARVKRRSRDGGNRSPAEQKSPAKKSGTPNPNLNLPKFNIMLPRYKSRSPKGRKKTRTRSRSKHDAYGPKASSG